MAKNANLNYIKPYKIYNKHNHNHFYFIDKNLVSYTDEWVF